MPTSKKLEFPFISRYKNLPDVLTDHELAALGDAYVNFVFSLALSRKFNRPMGEKAESRMLANALRKANLRRLLPPRIDRHKQADAAEAVIVYGWIRGIVTIEECVAILEEKSTPNEAFSVLLQKISTEISF